MLFTEMNENVSQSVVIRWLLPCLRLSHSLISSSSGGEGPIIIKLVADTIARTPDNDKSCIWFSELIT